MKKVLVTGGNGQLGSDIVQALSHQDYDVVSKNHQHFDITQFNKVKHILIEERPDIIINTAAFHHVDQCEADPDQAMLINCNAPTFLAGLCSRMGIQFVHFSTDYVFDGSKKAPYIETDTTQPLNVYGKSKRQGEIAILDENPDALILRVSALYGIQPCRAKNGLNFIRLMQKLGAENGMVKVVTDEVVSPTSTQSIAQKLPELLKQNLSGIVHLTSEGSCSWYEFAKAIFEYSGMQDVAVVPVVSSAFPGKTPRPTYSVLENYRLKIAGIPSLPTWQESLKTYLNDIRN